MTLLDENLCLFIQRQHLVVVFEHNHRFLLCLISRLCKFGTTHNLLTAMWFKIWIFEQTYTEEVAQKSHCRLLETLTDSLLAKSLHSEGVSLLKLHEKADYAFIAPKPQEGWARAIVNKEKQVGLFSLLGQADAFDSLIFLHAHGEGQFTPGYFAQETALPQERAQQLLAVFGEYDLVHEEKVAIDDRTETRYTAHKNPAVVPLLAFALELADRPNVFNYYRGSEEALL